MKPIQFIPAGCVLLLLLPFIIGCPCQNNPCDDGLFCNGLEMCTPEQGQAACSEGMPPCDEGEICDEETDACITINPEECTTLRNNAQEGIPLNTSGRHRDRF